MIIDPRVPEALELLAKRGFPTDQMNGQFVVLGAFRSEQTGPVRDWLYSLVDVGNEDDDELGDLLNTLKSDSLMDKLTKSPYFTERGN
jgi:hypothetical protein